MLIGYRYIGEGMPGPRVQLKRLIEMGCEHWKTVAPIPLDNAPSREYRDWLINYKHTFRDKDTMAVADACVLADNKDDAKRILGIFKERNISIHVYGEDPRPVKTKEDFDYWLERITTGKKAKPRRTGRPSKWSIKSLPERDQKAIIILYYSDANLEREVIPLCQEHGAPSNLNRPNLWGQLGPKDGTGKPEWVRKLLKK